MYGRKRSFGIKRKRGFTSRRRKQKGKNRKYNSYRLGRGGIRV